MAARANLVIDQGTNISSDVTVKDLNANAFDLTGYTATAKMAKGYESTKTRSTITATVSSTPSSGLVALTMTAAQTAALSPGRYVYDLEITQTSSGNITRVIEGIITVTPQVSL